MRSNGADILVVDDEADIRDLVSGLLEDEGHSVRVASSSEEALAAIRARKPSLLVLDIWMQGGGMDGLELLDVVKTLDADLPVVMISGKDGYFDKVRGRMSGATGYITKPFGPEALMKAVEMYLSGSVPEMEQ